MKEWTGYGVKFPKELLFSTVQLFSLIGCENLYLSWNLPFLHGKTQAMTSSSTLKLITIELINLKNLHEPRSN